VPPKQYRQHRFSPPPGATEFILVRHGESAAAVDGERFDLVDGQGDPPLAPDGLEQAQRVADRLGAMAVDAIYVTTLRRTAQTAAPLAARLGITPTVEADLREVHLGEWEGGEFRRRVANADPLAVQLLVEERWDVIPGAESATAFSTRVVGAVTRLAQAHPGQRLVVFSHGGTIGEVLRQAVGAERGFAFTGSDNGAISQLVIHGDRWILRGFNDTSHLGPDGSGAPEDPETGPGISFSA